MEIKSKLYSLAEIVNESPNWHFNIPIYQRLYVWGAGQVRTLLNDLVNAYEGGEDLFFLGGTLLVEQGGRAEKCFDLIDGQQRFTTLWLLCHAWRNALQPFLQAKKGEIDETRLRFAIRPEVNHFLEALVFRDFEKPDTDEESTGRMRTALDLMTSVFEQRRLPEGVVSKEMHLAGLTEYVFSKVKFVITTVPRQTDLNKLFEAINNRGVQLQHHEILKARMLKALTVAERSPYAILWESCADMDNFVERNLIGNSTLQTHEVSALYKRDELSNAQIVLDKLQEGMQKQDTDHAQGLEAILKSAEEFKTSDENSDENTLSTGVRSIFGFPLFLQHTLRIWLMEEGREDLPRLLDRELLALFSDCFFSDPPEKANNNVKSFIELLWRLRVIFDENIIKWADQGNDEIHLISRISESLSGGKAYMSRARDTDSHRGLCLLQSMLYHSQEITTQYWVTPLLFFMHRNAGATADRFYEYLRHLDNHLLGSAAEGSLAVRTRAFMAEPWRRQELIHDSELTKTEGVKFAHYWFYKLEFVLWFLEKRKTEGWKKFRFTAKSSVEHISPQTPTDAIDERVIDALDGFGNVALVSRSLNSEYGNRPYKVKREQFLHKNKGKLDSLKMDLIYEHDKWTDGEAFAHRDSMIADMTTYCNETPRA